MGNPRTASRSHIPICHTAHMTYIRGQSFVASSLCVCKDDRYQRLVGTVGTSFVGFEQSLSRPRADVIKTGQLGLAGHPG